MPLPQAIFLDAAGTLLHLREPLGHTYAHYAVRHGLTAEPGKFEAGFRAAWKSLPPPVHPEGKVSEDDDRSWWHSLVQATARHAVRENLTQEEVEPLFDDLYLHYADPDAWLLYPDTVPTLEVLSQFAKLYVLSNFDRRLRGVLLGLGVSKYFEDFIISSEVGASKPHPRIFARALELAGAPPGQCVHIGDDPRADGEGAAAAGIQGIVLNRPEFDLAAAGEKIQQG